MNKKRLGLLVVLIVGGLLLLRKSRSAPPHEPPTEADEDRGASSAPERPRFPALPLLPAPTAEADPVVEEIEVEKKEVCSGEDNFVTLKLSSAANEDDQLRVVMLGFDVSGTRMPFRLALGAGGTQPEMPEIVVFGKDGMKTTVKVPPVKVKDCAPPASLAVHLALTPNAFATYAMTAVIRQAEGGTFQPRRWYWDFGDGSYVTTEVPAVEHSYEDRPQKTRFSNFTVLVRAVDAAGKEVRGLQPVELRNPAFETLRMKNVVMIWPELNPRFPTMQPNGQVVQRVRLRHAYDQPVTLERVTVERLSTGPDGREQRIATEATPREVLGADVIAPGEGLEATVVLDTRSDPDTDVMNFELMGTTADGKRARGSFSVLKPEAEIPREQQERVTDPHLVAQLVAAQARLGRQEVTLDELQRLRREGALANATGGDNTGAPAEDREPTPSLRRKDGTTAAPPVTAPDPGAAPAPDPAR
jgi:hypothetical protein